MLCSVGPHKLCLHHDRLFILRRHDAPKGKATRTTTHNTEIKLKKLGQTLPTSTVAKHTRLHTSYALDLAGARRRTQQIAGVPRHSRRARRA